MWEVKRVLSDLIPTQQAEHRDLREGEAGVTLCLAAGLQATLLSQGRGRAEGEAVSGCHLGP